MVEWAICTSLHPQLEGQGKGKSVITEVHNTKKCLASCVLWLHFKVFSWEKRQYIDTFGLCFNGWWFVFSWKYSSYHKRDSNCSSSLCFSHILCHDLETSKNMYINVKRPLYFNGFVYIKTYLLILKNVKELL